MTPNPAIPSQAAVLQGSSIAAVPFTSDLPVTATTLSDSSSSSSASTSTPDASATMDGSGGSSAATGKATATSIGKSDASLNFPSSLLLWGLGLVSVYRYS